MNTEDEKYYNDKFTGKPLQNIHGNRYISPFHPRCDFCALNCKYYEKECVGNKKLELYLGYKIKNGGKWFHSEKLFGDKSYFICNRCIDKLPKTLIIDDKIYSSYD